MKFEILMVILMVAIVFSYGAIGGVTAAWGAHLIPEDPGAAIVFGFIWPAGAPVLLGVQVYQWLAPQGDSNEAI